jgi:vacuolar protein sorting-associated protein 26
VPRARGLDAPLTAPDPCPPRLPQNLFGNLSLGGQACAVQLEFDDGPAGARFASVRGRRGEREALRLFADGDTLAGRVVVTPVPGRRVEHLGVRVQLLGAVELAAERGAPHEFLSLVRDLAPPGQLTAQASFPFEFRGVEMADESYRGAAAALCYALRVTVARGLGQSLTRDYPFWVRNAAPPPPGAARAPIAMEVGIEDCLHIEFEYDRAAYRLDDVVVGRIHFLLVRIRLKHMELEVRRRETSGGGAAARAETTTVAKYEIMDGAPARGEVVPIRLHLAPYELSPTYPNVHNKFSVRYFLNLVLVDEEDRRYFKQQEVALYRGEEGEAGEAEVEAEVAEAEAAEARAAAAEAAAEPEPEAAPAASPPPAAPSPLPAAAPPRAASLEAPPPAAPVAAPAAAPAAPEPLPEEAAGGMMDVSLDEAGAAERKGAAAE